MQIVTRVDSKQWFYIFKKMGIVEFFQKVSFELCTGYFMAFIFHLFKEATDSLIRPFAANAEAQHGQQ
jgi:hypothetical protein